MAEKPLIWISRAMMDSSLTRPFDADIYLSDPDTAVDAIRRNKEGEPLPAARFPEAMYVSRKHSHQKKQPDIAYVGGFWTVTAECADVLSKFDLGDSNLYPTKLYQYDRKTLVEGDYFCLNFGAQKNTLLPDASPRIQKPHEDQDMWKAWPNVRDGDIALSLDATNGPDLWIEIHMRRAFFLSDLLVQALKAAKLTRCFGLRKCRVL